MDQVDLNLPMKPSCLSPIESEEEDDIEIIEKKGDKSSPTDLEMKPSLCKIPSSDRVDERERRAEETYNKILKEIYGHHYLVDDLKYKLRCLQNQSGHEQEIRKITQTLGREKAKIESLEGKAFLIHKRYPTSKWRSIPRMPESEEDTSRSLEIDLDGIEEAKSDSSLSDSVEEELSSDNTGSVQKFLSDSKISTSKELEQNVSSFKKELESRDKIIGKLEEKYFMLDAELNTMKKEQQKLKKSYSKISLPGSSKEATSSFSKLPTSHTKSRKLPKSSSKEEKLEQVYLAMRAIFESGVEPLQTLVNPTMKAQERDSVKNMKKVTSKSIVKTESQDSQIVEYQEKYEQAQDKIKRQISAIELLQLKNKHLEKEIDTRLAAMKSKFDQKMKSYTNIPKLLKIEREKLDRVTKEKNELSATVKNLRFECETLKTKFIELSKKRNISMVRMRKIERDSTVFKNQNVVLKEEKRNLIEELAKLKDELKSVNATSNRNLARTKERFEIQKRGLQRKIIQLEGEISTIKEQGAVAVEHRDKLILELQKQLNTLAANFETSQKHLRLLRRHIFSLTGNMQMPQKIDSKTESSN